MSSWRSGGIGPAKTNAGLRGLGLIAVVIAFLAVSNSFLAQDDPEGTTGSTPPRATVLAPEALRAVLPVAVPYATYTFGEPAQLRARVESGDPGDVLITDPETAAALRTADRCSAAVPIADRGDQRFVGCLTGNGSGAATDAGAAYLRAATGLEARAALIDAGFEVGAR